MEETDTETRSRELIDKADRERKLFRITEMQKYKKEDFTNLMQSVELSNKFVTADQVSRAKELILEGIATDAEEAYEIMVGQGNKVNDVFSRD